MRPNAQRELVAGGVILELDKGKKDKHNSEPKGRRRKGSIHSARKSEGNQPLKKKKKKANRSEFLRIKPQKGKKKAGMRRGTEGNQKRESKKPGWVGHFELNGGGYSGSFGPPCEKNVLVETGGGGGEA